MNRSLSRREDNRVYGEPLDQSGKNQRSEMSDNDPTPEKEHILPPI